MKQLKCETCGSTLELNGDGLHAVCHTCGNVYEYRSPKEELAVQQMNEANDLRINMDFDEAIRKYRLVTKSNPEDAEGYWGLLLSKYGIAYECEPDTMKYVPTFHRNRRGNIREDASAQNALKYATPAQKETYEKALDELRYIQEGIEDFADNCDPYDVFISFKATEVGGDTKTIDRDIAYNIYDELNSRGIRTFFSEVSLRSMVAEDYEAVIFNALNTCRVFILVGTSKENIDSLWVKNEWTRYNERVAEDRLNGLPQSSRFAVLGGTLKPSELPREFARTQNVMLSNYAGDSYKKDIAYSVETLLGIKKEETKPAIDENDVKAMVDRLVNERVASSGNTTATPKKTSAQVALDNLIQRIKIFIDDNDWTNASQYIERALDKSPLNPMLYVLKAQVNHKLNSINDIVDSGLMSDLNLDNAIKFADGEYKVRLENIRNTMKDNSIRAKRLAERKAAELAEEKRKQEERDRIAREKRAEYVKKQDEYISLSKRLNELNDENTNYSISIKDDLKKCAENKTFIKKAVPSIIVSIIAILPVVILMSIGAALESESFTSISMPFVFVFSALGLVMEIRGKYYYMKYKGYYSIVGSLIIFLLLEYFSLGILLIVLDVKIFTSQKKIKDEYNTLTIESAAIDKIDKGEQLTDLELKDLRIVQYNAQHNELIEFRTRQKLAKEELDVLENNQSAIVEEISNNDIEEIFGI